MHWKRLLAAWQLLEIRIEAALMTFDRRERERTVPVEVISTEGWTEEENGAWLESMRRAHDLRRAERRRSLPDQQADDSASDHDRKG